MLRDLAQIVELGEQAGNGDSRRSDEETKRLVFVVASFSVMPQSRTPIFSRRESSSIAAKWSAWAFQCASISAKIGSTVGAAASTAVGIVAATAAPAAMVSKCRRAWSTGGLILDVVIRGVLSTLSAWVILDLAN
jgi:hypothetical protein